MEYKGEIRDAYHHCVDFLRNFPIPLALGIALRAIPVEALEENDVLVANDAMREAWRNWVCRLDIACILHDHQSTLVHDLLVLVATCLTLHACTTNKTWCAETLKMQTQ